MSIIHKMLITRNCNSHTFLHQLTQRHTTDVGYDDTCIGWSAKNLRSIYYD